MKRFALYVLLLFGICLAYAHAQTDTQDEPDTTDYHPMIAQFEEQSAHPGDVVTLKLSFQLPKGMIVPENTPIDGIQDFHVLGIDTNDSEIAIKLLVDTIDTFDVPSLTVMLTHDNGTPMYYKSDPVMLTLDLPFDETDTELNIHDIKGIFEVNSKKLYLIITIVCLLLLITGMVLFFVIKKRRQKIIEQAYQKTPEEIACDALRDLDRDAHLFRDNVKAYYFRLTQILKEYMGQIRGFPVAEMTTEEIASRVKEKMDIEMVRLMRKADMIKFADFIPTTAERETHSKDVWSYVKETSDERNQEMNSHE